MNRLKLEDILLDARISISSANHELQGIITSIGLKEKLIQCTELDNVYNLLGEALKEVQDDLSRELKYENEYEKTNLIGKENTVIFNEREIEELKESIRSITAMDKEEPWEQVERLLGDVKDLTARNRKLEDENESIHEELLIEKQRMSMLSASFEMLEYQKNVLEGEVKQANVTLQMLCK